MSCSPLSPGTRPWSETTEAIVPPVESNSIFFCAMLNHPFLVNIVSGGPTKGKISLVRILPDVLSKETTAPKINVNDSLHEIRSDQDANGDVSTG